MSGLKKYFYNATIFVSSLEKEEVIWGIIPLDLNESLEEQIIAESNYTPMDIDRFNLTSLSELTDTSPVVVSDVERKAIIEEFVASCLAKELKDNEVPIEDRGELDYMWDLSDVEKFIPTYLKSKSK